MIGAVVTRGYGSFAGVRYIVPAGYLAGDVAFRLGSVRQTMSHHAGAQACEVYVSEEGAMILPTPSIQAIEVLT